VWGEFCGRRSADIKLAEYNDEDDMLNRASFRRFNDDVGSDDFETGMCNNFSFCI